MLPCGVCDCDIRRYSNIRAFANPAEVSDESSAGVAPNARPQLVIVGVSVAAVVAPNVRPQLVIAGVAVAVGGQGTRAPLPDAAAL